MQKQKVESKGREAKDGGSKREERVRKERSREGEQYNKVNRLVLHGFKSFANKTVIPFYEGFNAIIGPNGAGKSNIIDAFVFVLGSSSRDLRAGRMDHVIYNGGYGRKGAEWAEVQIAIDNTNRKLPYDEDEVVISRRVNRKGVSYYRVNGKLESKEYITEMLKSIGVKASGHNIIQQGDIINVIKMKPRERREIIDKVAGIDEYNKKKEKAKGEMEQAEKNLNEARIILEQKKEYLDKIKKERDFALKVKELEDKRNYLVAQLAYSKLKSVEAEKERVRENLEIKEKEYESIKKEIGDYDIDFEAIENEIKTLEGKIIKKSMNKSMRNKIEEIMKKIYEREGKIRENEKEISYLRDYINKLNSLASPKTRNREGEVLNILEKEGVRTRGFFKDLISTDKKYSLAIEIAIGGHMYDIVMDDDREALKAIDILKKHKLPRMRFLPLSRLEVPRTSAKAEAALTMPGVIGYATSLIDYPPEVKRAVDYVLRDTIIVESKEDARRIRGVRAVTLEGELFEASGAIIGGTIKKEATGSLAVVNTDEIRKAEKKIESLVKENEQLNSELEDLRKLMEDMRSKEEGESKEVLELQESKKKLEEKLEEIRSKRKGMYEKMLLLEQEINNLKMKKARLEAEYDNVVEDFEPYKEKVEEMKLEVEDPLKIDRMIKKIDMALREIGLVNMKAIEEYEEMKKEFDAYMEKVKKLEEERKSIEEMIQKIEEKRRIIFFEAFNKINENFGRIFESIEGGRAMIEMEKEGDIDSGLLIKAQPRDKKLLSIDSLSGGEKTLVSLAFLLAIQHYKKTPFYLLDEVDAALDKVNSEKIGDLIAEYSKESQFIVISHNDITVKKAQRVYGVAMQKGVSQVFGVELEK